MLEGHRPVRRVHDRAHRVVGHGHQAMTDTERLGNRFGDCGATCARREQRGAASVERQITVSQTKPGVSAECPQRIEKIPGLIHSPPAKFGIG